MPCLFALLAGFMPRVAFLIYWLARPNSVSAVFNGSWIWPLLGLIFLPFTTLFYVLLWTPGIGLNGWDWLWIGMAVLLDISHYMTSYRDRNQIPGYSGSV